MPELTPEKQAILDRALINPNDEHSRAIIAKARERGWIPNEGPLDKGDIVATSESDKANVSAPESFITGASVGGSVGLTRPVLAAAGITQGLSPKESWKLSGEFIKEAKSQNPKSYTGGLLASIVAPGGGFSQISKGVTTGLKAAAVAPRLAGLAGTTVASGIQAGGQAIAESKENAAADEMIKGMALNIGAFGAGEAIKGTGSVLKKGGQRLISSLQNISRDAIETYEKNPKAVNALIADKLGNFAPQLADDVASKIQDVGMKLEGDLTNIVTKHKAPVDMGSVVSEIKTQIGKLERVQATPDKRAALDVMKKALSRFFEDKSVIKTVEDPYLGTISKASKVSEPVAYSASDLLEMKRDFQRAAEAVYEGQATGPIQEAFAAVAKKAADSLKNQVKGTGTILEAQQAAIKAKNALGLKGDADPARMKNLLATLFNPDKVQKGAIKSVDEFDRIYGTNLKEAAQLFRSAAQLGKEDLLSGYGTGRALLFPALGHMGAGNVGGLAGLFVQSPGVARYGITGTKKVKSLLDMVGGALPKATRAYQASKE